MPVALAPGMGLNAYFAYQVIHLSDLHSTKWQISLCPCQSHKGCLALTVSHSHRRKICFQCTSLQAFGQQFACVCRGVCQVVRVNV